MQTRLVVLLFSKTRSNGAGAELDAVPLERVDAAVEVAHSGHGSLHSTSTRHLPHKGSGAPPQTPACSSARPRCPSLQTDAALRRAASTSLFAAGCWQLTGNDHDDGLALPQIVHGLTRQQHVSVRVADEQDDAAFRSTSLARMLMLPSRWPFFHSANQTNERHIKPGAVTATTFGWPHIEHSH